MVHDVEGSSEVQAGGTGVEAIVDGVNFGLKKLKESLAFVRCE